MQWKPEARLVVSIRVSGHFLTFHLFHLGHSPVQIYQSLDIQLLLVFILVGDLHCTSGTIGGLKAYRL